MTVRFRPRFGPLGLILYGLIFVRMTLNAVTGQWPGRVGGSACAVLVVVLLVLQPRSGVDLTPEALVLRGLRRIVLPWREITHVEALSTMGTRTVRVTARGHRYRLRAPIHSLLVPDPAFDQEVATIREWWQRARAPREP
ncbi:MAG TPA: hypothetical protein VFQ85_11475 [Mycobacteriales bacterium]|nr:hypothetical protein [Mycobacteriales bacterium]